MRGRVIALDRWKGACAAALIVDGQLDDLITDPPADIARPGTVVRAVVDRPIKGQGGAFVRLPDGKTGFLRTRDALRSGQPVPVQVSGYAEPGKAVPVTTKLIFKGRYVLVTPGAPGINVSRRIRDDEERTRLLDAVENLAVAAAPFGLIIRSQAVGVAATDLAGEAETLFGIATAVLVSPEGAPALLREGPDAHELAARDWDADLRDGEPGSFARHGVDEMLDRIGSPLVELGGGASAWVEPTRALIAVDVNTGADASPAAGLKANIGLAGALPRQLRCRGLGGQVTVDPAPMAKRDRRQFEQALRAAFRNDATETALVGWTPLGHFELQRKRDRFPFV